jgi:RNA polymerase sigma-70 factor (ECF subfamily)
MTILDSPPVSTDLGDAGDDECGALLQSTASGDGDAFARLYDLLAPGVYGVIADLIADQVRAEAVLHEVFGEVWRHAPRLAGTGVSARAWLREVAYVRCGSFAH